MYFDIASWKNKTCSFQKFSELEKNLKIVNIAMNKYTIQNRPAPGLRPGAAVMCNKTKKTVLNFLRNLHLSKIQKL